MNLSVQLRDFLSQTRLFASMTRTFRNARNPKGGNIPGNLDKQDPSDAEIQAGNGPTAHPCRCLWRGLEQITRIFP